MEKMVHIVCSATALILLSACGEQLASDAQRAADRVAEEAARTTSKKLDEFKDIAREKLRVMRGAASSGAAGDSPVAEPDGAANSRARPEASGLVGPKKAAAKIIWA